MALNHYLVGSQVVMVNTCMVRDPVTGDGTPTTPTSAIFTRVQPDGTTTTYTNGDPEVDNPTVGMMTCTVTVDKVGEEKWRCDTLGSCQSASEDVFKVERSVVV